MPIVPVYQGRTPTPARDPPTGRSVARGPRQRGPTTGSLHWTRRV